MADKVETLTDLFDLLDLDTAETERLISYLRGSIPGDTVLVRYPGRFIEDWLDDEAVTPVTEESP